MQALNSSSGEPIRLFCSYDSAEGKIVYDLLNRRGLTPLRIFTGSSSPILEINGLFTSGFESTMTLFFPDEC